jgi:hypothetical protein
MYRTTITVGSPSSARFYLDLFVSKIKQDYIKTDIFSTDYIYSCHLCNEGTKIDRSDLTFFS